MNRLYFMRHGQSQANAKNVYAGQDNVPLTDAGEQKARAAARACGLKGQIDVIYSSDLDRAYNSARVVAEELGLDPSLIRQDRRLREADLGRLSGTTEPADSFSYFLKFARDRHNDQGVEYLGDIQDRLQSWLDDLKDVDGTVLVVAHCGSGMVLRSILHGHDGNELETAPPIQNADIIQFYPVTAAEIREWQL